MLDQIKRLCEHAAWADRLLAEAFGSAGEEAALARKEFGHVLGTAETWLARIEGRPATLAIWPDISPADLKAAVAGVHGRYSEFVGRLPDDAFAQEISYVNSVGKRFTNRIEDILLHGALHGQYHRGKINLLFRQAGMAPVPTDYIAFIRGVPAAITKPR